MNEISHKLSYLITGFIINIALVVLAVWLGTGQMAFVLLAMVYMYCGRRLGWALSKRLLYPIPEPGSVLISIAWGGIIAFAICILIEWQHPNLILRIIFGYMLGAYVAIPNYGLLNEATIPTEEKTKHERLYTWPLLTYIATSLVCAWVVNQHHN